MKTFKDYFIASAVSVVMGSGAGMGVTYATKEAPKIIVNGASKPASRYDVRRAQERWDEFAQKDVDAITRAMNSEPKRDVVIFCENEDRCGDAALDLENAFESAHWTVSVQRPLFNDNTGFCVTDERMAVTLRKVFGDRITIKVIQSSLPDNTVGIVLGKRV